MTKNRQLFFKMTLLICLSFFLTAAFSAGRMFDISRTSPDEWEEMRKMTENQKPVTQLEMTKIMNTLINMEGKEQEKPLVPYFTKEEREKIPKEREQFLSIRLLIGWAFYEAEENPARMKELKEKVPRSFWPTTIEKAVIQEKGALLFGESK